MATAEFSIFSGILSAALSQHHLSGFEITHWNSITFTRPFRYDLNKIPYDYAVEVTNRFKGLDLIHTLPEELWTEVRNTVQEVAIKTIPKGKMQEGKVVI